MRDHLATATTDDLNRDPGEPNPAPGFPPPAARTALECLQVLFNEEWAHHRYAVRDLAELRQTRRDASPIVGALDLGTAPGGRLVPGDLQAAHSFTPDGYPGPRSAATAIYFLLHPGERSRWHARPVGRAVALALRRPARTGAGRGRPGPGRTAAGCCSART